MYRILSIEEDMPEGVEAPEGAWKWFKVHYGLKPEITNRMASEVVQWVRARNETEVRNKAREVITKLNARNDHVTRLSAPARKNRYKVATL